MRMRLLPLLLTAVLQLVNGFVVLKSPRHELLATTTRNSWKESGNTFPLFSSKEDTDDYDDWYADFDPADYQDVGRDASRSTINTAAASGHDYARDFNADSSNVDEVTVHNLIAERLQCRKTGRYQEADAIRDILLKKHGVAIFDREKVWRTGCSTGGSGMKWKPGRGAGTGTGSRGGPPRKRDFGPYGHDYELAQDAGPNASSLDVTQIHELLAERLEYKMNRDFRNADAIQEKLIQAGVFVHDGNKEWRADGQGFGDYRGQGGRPGRERGSRSDRSRPYEQSSYSLQAQDVATIQDLVNERSEAKGVRDYQVADDILDELRANFNVEVNDRLRMWSVGGDFGIPQSNGKYTMSEMSETPEDAKEIQQLVEERNEARKKRDFDTADAIREELLDRNIMIDDKLRQWALGDKFSVKNNKRNASFDSPFIKRGIGGELTKEQEALVEKLLQERSDAKRDKEFRKADRIRDRLEADFKVRIDDRAREWHVVSENYAMNPFSEIEEDTRALIEDLIVERAVAKLERDYETADAIRDELADVYGVLIDDRVREWRIIGAPMDGGAQIDDSIFEVEESDFEVDEDIEDLIEGDEVADETESFADETTKGEDLDTLTIPELKMRLKDAGLPVSGRKAELIERLNSLAAS